MRIIKRLIRNFLSVLCNRFGPYSSLSSDIPGPRVAATLSLLSLVKVVQADADSILHSPLLCLAVGRPYIGPSPEVFPSCCRGRNVSKIRVRQRGRGFPNSFAIRPRLRCSTPRHTTRLRPTSAISPLPAPLSAPLHTPHATPRPTPRSTLPTPLPALLLRAPLPALLPTPLPAPCHTSPLPSGY